MKKLSFVFIILFVLVGALSTDASARCRNWPDCGPHEPPPPPPPLEQLSFLPPSIYFYNSRATSFNCESDRGGDFYVRFLTTEVFPPAVPQGALRIVDAYLTDPNGGRHSILDTAQVGIVGATPSVTAKAIKALFDNINLEGTYGMTAKISASGYAVTPVSGTFQFPFCD